MQEKSKNVVRKVVHRRNEYTCTLKNNRITVRAQRTAAGQNMGNVGYTVAVRRPQLRPPRPWLRRRAGDPRTWRRRPGLSPPRGANGRFLGLPLLPQCPRPRHSRGLVRPWVRLRLTQGHPFWGRDQRPWGSHRDEGKAVGAVSARGQSPCWALGSQGSCGPRRRHQALQGPRGRQLPPPDQVPAAREEAAAREARRPLLRHSAGFCAAADLGPCLRRTPGRPHRRQHHPSPVHPTLR